MKANYRGAVHDAIAEAMRADERVVLLGEDVGRYGGTYAVSKGLLEEFGPERIRDTPISELGFVGIGIGAALNGLRPIVEIMTVNFSLLALDQIVNTAAPLRHMSNGQFSVPLVIRMATGAGRQLAAQHSHSLENWYAHIPGITVLAPATVADAYGMLRTALTPRPGDHLRARRAVQHLDRPRSARATDIARAAVRRSGTDATLVAYGGSLPKVLDAAEQLAQTGIDCEVIDLRVLRPLDDATILESVRKTHRAVIVDEGWRTGSLAAEVSARIVEGAFYDLDAPIARVCTAEVPIPYAKHLEQAALPQPDDDRGRGARPVRGDRVIEFTMPALGADMDEGTLNEWLIKPGDTVTRGQIVAVVETTKAAVEIECWQDGVVGELLVPIGQTVAVGTPLATILEAGVKAEPRAAAPPVEPSRQQPEATRRRGTPGRTRGRRAVTGGAPAVGLTRWHAETAASLGVDLENVQRHRPAGRGHAAATSSMPPPPPITKPPKPAPATKPRPRLNPSRPPEGPRTRRGHAASIAAAMGRSKREIPHYYLADEIILDTALSWLTEQNAGLPITERMLPAVLQLKAVALAAQRFKEFNGFWHDDGFEASRASPCGRGDLAARRRPGGPGDPRRQREEARRIDARPDRPGGPGPRRIAAQLGDVRPDHHPDQPRRQGRRRRLRHHLSAAGGHRRLRQARPAGRRGRRRDPGGHHGAEQPGRRPPRQRRRTGRTVPRRDQPAAPAA